MAQPPVRVRFFLPLSILILLSTASAQPIEHPYVAGELILSFAAETKVQQSQDILYELGATRIVQFNRIDAGLYRLDSMTVEEALQLLDGNAYFAFAEPNYIVYEHAIPDDPRFDDLWGMENTGQTGGTAGADISAVEAWNIFTGTRDVVVGVIDTGLDISHPDIADNVFLNEGEIAGNGVDDDGNGFIDDVNGWDFANNDNNPFDDRGHGTHVSGTIGGVGNNGVGVAGVNWSVRILPIKFLGSDGSGSTAAAVQAVEYATLMGVDLTNNSWGGGGFSAALLAAIEDADAAGIHFVASAGNSGRDTDSAPSYPASYDTPNIISVAATDHNDQLAGFSNYGVVSVDLGAPGVSILSTVPGSGYSFFDGTSMAAPHVAGVVAMMVGRFPLAPHDALKQRLLMMADPIPALAGRTVSGARLNAFMAIADPDETPPAPVDDLMVMESGSNWLRVAWSATGDDGGEGTAVSYEMRRAEFLLDEANFDTGILVEGLSPPMPFGEPEEHVVDGLDFLTTYWIALVARDEFGNTSLVSNSPSGMTLGIPTVAVSPTSLSEALLTGASSSQSLSLSNTGEGTLDFAFGPIEYLEIPTPGAVATALGQSIETYLAQYDAARPLAKTGGIDRAKAPDGFTGRSPASVVRDYFEVLQSQVDGPVLYSDDMESGAPGWSHGSTSGSVDQWALVTTRSASGSHSWNVSQHSGSGADALVSPPIDLPALPELRLAVEHWYNFDGCGGDTTFEPDGGIIEVSTDGGTSWTQIFPLAGYPYVLDDICSNPLAFLDAYSHDGGAGAEFVPAVFDLNAFGGNTVVLRFHAGWDCGNCDSNEGWFVDDVTVFADVPPWLGVDLVSGSLTAGESTEVGVIFNATGLFGGLHTANLVIGSNDPVTPELRVPVDLTVTGVPDIAVIPSAIDFGTIFVDGSEQLTLSIENVGTDVLTISDISVDHADFTLSASSAVLGFGEAIAVDVTYAPTAPGPVQPTITILSNDPDEATLLVPVSAAGIDPPDVSVAPTSLASDLFTGGVDQQTLTISNDGIADLVFSLEAFAVEGSLSKSTGSLPMTSERIFQLAEGDGEVINGSPEQALATGLERVYGTDPTILVYTDNTLHPPGSDVVEIALQRMGLAYTVEYSSTSNFISLLNGGVWDLVIIDNSLTVMVFDDVEAYVIAGGSLILSYWDIDGSADQPSSLWPLLGVVPTQDVFSTPPIYRWDLSHSLFNQPNAVPDFTSRVDTVNDNGDKLAAAAGAALLAGYTPTIQPGEGGLLLSAAYPAIVHGFLPGENPADLDGDSILDAVELYENEIEYLLGGANWLSVEPDSGILASGESIDLSVGFDASSLFGGTYTADIVISSNDPDESELRVPTTLTVTGVPNLVLDPVAVEFGTVLLGGSAVLPLTLLNDGTDQLLVSDIAADDSVFSVDITSLALDPGASTIVTVSYTPVAPVPSTATLTITSNDPGQPATAVPLSGDSALAPLAQLDPSSVDAELFIGETQDFIVTLSNAGEGELRFQVGSETGITEAESIVALPFWLSIAPTEGAVAPGESVDLTVSLDVAGLAVGLYTLDAPIGTNDPLSLVLTLSVSLRVRGRPVLTLQPELLDMGSVLVGGDRVLGVMVRNDGTDVLQLTDVVVSDPTLEPDLTTATLWPYQSVFVSITWTPLAVGDLSAQLEFVSNDPFSPAILPVIGSAELPARLALEPESFEAGALPSIPAHRILTLSNSGEGPLSFDLSVGDGSAFTASEGAAKDRGGPIAMGYRWIDSDEPGGPNYAWEDISTFGTRLGFGGSIVDSATSAPIASRFGFEYFGFTAWSFRVSTDGWISPAGGGVYPNNLPLPSQSAPFAMIAPFWDDLLYNEALGSAIYYHLGERKTIVQYENMRRDGGPTSESFSFQIILERSGDIRFQYEQLDGADDTVTVGFQGPNRVHGMTIAHEQSYLHEQLAVLITQAPVWIELSGKSGELAPGESDEIAITFDPVGLVPGDHEAHILILSNDPIEPIKHLPITLHVGTLFVSDAFVSTPRLLLGQPSAPLVAHVELPPPFDVSQLDPSSARLFGAIAAQGDDPNPVGDADGDGIADLRLIFDTAGIWDNVSLVGTALLTLTGEIPSTGVFFGLPTVTIAAIGEITPDGNETILAGSLQEIRWNLAFPLPVSTATLSWSSDDGESWQMVQENVIGQVVDWEIPAVETATARVKVDLFQDGQRVGIVSSTAAFTITAVATSTDPIPREFALQRNWPNPFNPTTRIAFELPVKTRVTLEIFDVRGRRIRTLLDESREAGRHVVDWQGRSDRGVAVASGIYLYRIRAGSFVESRRMVLLK